MFPENQNSPEFEEARPDRTKIGMCVKASPNLSDLEKEEFLMLLAGLPDEIIPELAESVAIDAREALEGARFHLRIDEVSHMIGEFEQRMRSITGTVGRANRAQESYERRSSAGSALENLQTLY